jgi:arsenate reductase-like glutaredoxin family protein
VRAMIEAHAMDPKLHQVLTEQIPREMITYCLEEDGATFVRGLLEAQRAKVRADLDIDTATFLLVHAVEGVTHAAAVEQPAMLKDARLTRELARMVTRYLA